MCNEINTKKLAQFTHWQKKRMLVNFYNEIP